MIHQIKHGTMEIVSAGSARIAEMGSPDLTFFGADGRECAVYFTPTPAPKRFQAIRNVLRGYAYNIGGSSD